MLPLDIDYNNILSDLNIVYELHTFRFRNDKEKEFIIKQEGDQARRYINQ